MYSLEIKKKKCKSHVLNKQKDKKERSKKIQPSTLLNIDYVLNLKYSFKVYFNKYIRNLHSILC